MSLVARTMPHLVMGKYSKNIRAWSELYWFLHDFYLNIRSWLLSPMTSFALFILPPQLVSCRLNIYPWLPSPSMRISLPFAVRSNSDTPLTTGGAYQAMIHCTISPEALLPLLDSHTLFLGLMSTRSAFCIYRPRTWASSHGIHLQKIGVIRHRVSTSYQV